MDRNTFLAFALSFLVLALWMTWEAQRRPSPRTAPAPAATPVPAAPRAAALPDSSVPEPASAPAPPADVPEQRIRVENERFRAELSSHGAGLARWQLRDYFTSRKEGGHPVELTFFDAGEAVALATPFEELGLGDLSRAPFRVLEADARRVVFEYSARGVRVRKTYQFEPDSYLFHFGLEVTNGSQQALSPRFQVRWPAHAQPDASFQDLGLVVFREGELERVWVGAGFGSGLFGSGSGEDSRFEGGIEWAGVQTRYFLSVLVPDVPRDTIVSMSADAGRGLAQLGQRPISLPPGRGVERAFRVYVGPKEPERLQAVGAQLERSIDLGWAWIAPLTRGFNWLLRACYSVVPNYGVAIILITLMVRLVTAPLATKQMRSMKRLGELQPRLRAIQEKYKDDRQQQSQEMMKLYRESGVNPLGGCLPMLLQIPVFIALYYALQSSIDLRQAPFVAWIQDLASPETLFTLPGIEIPVRLLPLLMGVSMVAQQKLTPTTMDPAQARMMMTLMPVMFTVLFYQFPSGLVLYWLVSNLLAIAQQLWMNRTVTPAKA